jgi:peptide/nickel transport system substrate-binding protein
MQLFRTFTAGLAGLLLSSCANPLPQLWPPGAGTTDTAPGPTGPAPLETPRDTPTPEPRTLKVCAGVEPADLFLFNELTEAKRAVLATLYDGPLDRLDFDYRPVILLKLPSLADGDALIEPVPVQTGDQVLDDDGLLATLGPGVTVRPAGCRSSDCAYSYEGGALDMDRLRVTFHIRPGVQWADGADLTAADSVFGHRAAMYATSLMQNNGLASESLRSVLYTASYTAIDELTVEWTGLPGFLDPNYQANFFMPFPEHQLGGYTAEQFAEANEVLYAPLGWGPYHLVSWEHGQQIVLERNPHYYRRAEGLPYFDRLVFRFLGLGAADALANFADGRCDILLPETLSRFPSPEMAEMVRSGEARTVPIDIVGFEHLTFNIAPPAPSGDEGPALSGDEGPDPSILPLFADLRTRAAVAACLDRGALVSSLFYDLASPPAQLLPPSSPLMAGLDLPAHPYDPSRAAALLAAVGWQDLDGDGVLEAHGVTGIQDGTPLRFDLLTFDDPSRVQLSGLMAEQLRACGMDATARPLPARDLQYPSADALLSGRRFQLAETASPNGIEHLCLLGITSEISSEANLWTGRNIGGYSDPALDAACAAMAASPPDSPDYLATRQTALRLISEALLVLPLYSSVRFTLVRPDLTSLTGDLSQGSVLQAVEDLRLAP